MIREITKLKLPSYATLNKATVTLNHMGDKTITSEVAIDGQIAPDFSFDWEVVFDGAKYIMPLREPQATKQNDTFASKVNLTFKHWAQYQLQRNYFFTIASTTAGVAVADKFEASVGLDLENFCNLFNQVLNYYLGDKIQIDLNPNWKDSGEPVFVDINYSYLWDVLIKYYELWKVSWDIVPNPKFNDYEHYIIKVGYPTNELDHIFEYGFEGGLLKVERQVQDDNIRNIIYGRGGEKNLPYRYFKNVDPDNPSFPADPDWIPELANIPFNNLRSAEFRSYVQGWKYRIDRYPNPLENSRLVGRNDTKVEWAWVKGLNDNVFDPIEFVKDDKSIRKYGELVGSLENNEEIYPSIQGVVLDNVKIGNKYYDFGRIDEAVDVQQVTNDAPENITMSNANIVDTIPLGMAMSDDFVEIDVKDKPTQLHVDLGQVEIRQGYRGNLNLNFILRLAVNYDYYESPDIAESFNLANDFLPLEDSSKRAVAIDENGNEISTQGMEGGNKYTIRIYTYVKNISTHATIIPVKLVCEGVTIDIVDPNMSSIASDRLFDIWIKNVWQSEIGVDAKGNEFPETEEQYVNRVWKDILGNHLGDEAAICFSTGWLSTSEDYEFKILGPITTGIHYDTSKDINGVSSHWRITCIRSDADYESLGKLVPNTERQGAKGDKFYFVGINLPQYYVEWAENRLHGYKQDELDKVKDITPSWVVSLDKVRIGSPHYDDAVALIDQLHIGDSIRLADKRFIADTGYEENGKAYLPLYLQTITYKFNDGNAVNITPSVEVTLGNEYVTSANPVATLQGQIDVLSQNVSNMSLSNMQQIVRMVGDRIYLRKDGITDRSLSKTYFADLLAALGFRQGMVGGQGWGFFQDENGKWVLETDRLNVRDEMQVNNLVINQIQARGGMIIESAASMEVMLVKETPTSYICYFDTKGGSIGNLFEKDDIAYCHRFYPDNETLKLYKRVITNIGDDYIELSKTNAYGSGIPSKGDVIVQYGNISDKRRQFVIERDVMGGGYERMLSGLNSVTAQGSEYFFAGYQSSSGERLFIGNKSNNNWLEYKEGKLTICGTLNVTNNDGTYSPLEEYLNNLIPTQNDIEEFVKAVIDPQIEGLQSQLDGVIETWFGSEVPTLNNPPASNWRSESEYQNHAGDLYYDNSTGAAFRFSKEGNNWTWVAITDEAITKALALVQTKRRIFVQQPRPPYEVGDLWVNATYGNVFTNDIARCKSDRESGAFNINDWELASKYTDDTTANEALSQISGYEYLKTALEGNTTATGGLVLTSLIQLGTGSPFTVYSGINGIPKSNNKGMGIAAWYGGPMEDAQVEGVDHPNAAKSLFRFDGSGYLANGNISWDNLGGGYLAGGNISWDKAGSLTLNNGIKLDGGEQGVTNTIQSIVNTINNFTHNFIPVSSDGTEYTWAELNGTTKKLYAVKSTVGFYSESFMSAIGVNSTGSSGSVTITQSITQEENTVPSNKAVYNALKKIPENTIQYDQLKAFLSSNYSTLRSSSNPHVYQINALTTNLGLLMITSDSTNTTLSLLLFTKMKVSGTDIRYEIISGYPKLYKSDYTYATGYMREWMEIGSINDLDYDLPQSSDSENIYIPFVDSGSSDNNDKKMSVADLEPLVNAELTMGLANLRMLAEHNINRFSKPIAFGSGGTRYGYAKVLTKGNEITLIVETSYSINAQGLIGTPGTSQYNTYSSVYKESDGKFAWSNWKLINQIILE